ncbi:MAG: YicC family protein [Sulfitobacter sp.]|nr:YicC family protein [Sulfitobacter sp.]
MIKSMTGFAAHAGSAPPFSWTWELRAVNGKGLDLRLRVPDWVEGLETGLRKRLSDVAKRGNVTLSLRLSREESAGSALTVNEAQLETLLVALQTIERRAMDVGVSLAPSKATDILTMRGLLEQTAADEDTSDLLATLLADAETLIADFDAMRRAEGEVLKEFLPGQLEEVARLTDQAASEAEARSDRTRDTLQRNLARLLENADGLDQARLTQELALIAVKSDITEELDRLRAHIDAARALLSEGGAVGRKLDFLMQEFNREANTLCSKAQMKELTATGLALKAVIDQMREQVQNVE